MSAYDIKRNISNKDVVFTRVQQALDDIDARLIAGGGGGGGSTTWGGITGTLSNQTDLDNALDSKAAASHTHSIANVTGLQTALDGKAALSHSHAISDVTGLQAALDGKMAASAGFYFPGGF